MSNKKTAQSGSRSPTVDRRFAGGASQSFRPILPGEKRDPRRCRSRAFNQQRDRRRARRGDRRFRQSPGRSFHLALPSDPRWRRRPAGRVTSVLVIDDEAQIRHLLRVSLEKQGYAVHEAATAADGLRLALGEIPTSCSWTWGCPTAPMPSPSCAGGRPCLSSSSRCAMERKKSSSSLNPVRTTTWSSRSTWES